MEPNGLDQIGGWLAGLGPPVWTAVSAAGAPVWKALESAFVTSAIGSLAGALGGAWAAERITKRNAKFESALVDIRNANSAVTFAAGVASALVGLKRQFVTPMTAEFQELSARHAAHVADAAARGREAAGVFHFNPDAKMVYPQEMPIGVLGDILRINAGNDPLAWMVFQTLNQIVENIGMMLVQRNQIIEEMRSAPAEQAADKMAAYLGTPRPDGNTDARHSEIMRELPRNVDDALGFTKVLAEHISEHARKVATQFGKKAPPVRPADFTRAEELGVLPDMKEYYDAVAVMRGRPVEATANAGRPKI